jgi:hypothetical protein
MAITVNNDGTMELKETRNRNRGVFITNPGLP